jgi:hypothetical protein
MHVSPPVQKRLRAAAGAGSTTAARTTNTTATRTTAMLARVSPRVARTSNPSGTLTRRRPELSRLSRTRRRTRSPSPTAGDRSADFRPLIGRADLHAKRSWRSAAGCGVVREREGRGSSPRRAAALLMLRLSGRQDRFRAGTGRRANGTAGPGYGALESRARGRSATPRRDPYSGSLKTAGVRPEASLQLMRVTSRRATARTAVPRSVRWA